MDLVDIIVLATVIILVTILFALYSQVAKLKKENRRWVNGELLYKGNNLCSICQKLHKPSCPRVTLFLDECKDYVSPEQDRLNNRYDVYESPFR